jgi:septal ring factor EnvC (AmiA/AmiB activator)
MSEVKFTEEEMKQLNELQQNYINIQNAFGQISVNRIRLEQQLNDLNKTENDFQNQFAENQKNERNFVDSINKKYGDGNLNIETGIFTPKSTEK